MRRIGRSGTVALGCGAIFVVLTLALVGGPLPHLDETVRHWAVTHQRPGVRRLAVDARWFGEFAVVWPVLVVVGGAVAWRVRRPRLALLVIADAALLMGVVYVVKLAVGRSEAPFAAHAHLLAGGRGYPSGHVANAAVCWGLVAAVLAGHERKLRIVAPIAAIAITVLEVWSVVYGPSHWLTDAVAAVLLSAAAVAAFVAAGGTRLSRRRHF